MKGFASQVAQGDVGLPGRHSIGKCTGAWTSWQFMELYIVWHYKAKASPLDYYWDNKNWKLGHSPLCFSPWNVYVSNIIYEDDCFVSFFTFAICSVLPIGGRREILSFARVKIMIKVSELWDFSWVACSVWAGINSFRVCVGVAWICLHHTGLDSSSALPLTFCGYLGEPL